MKKKCKRCGSKIDHFGFTVDDFMHIRDADKDATVARMRSIGGKCPDCGKVSCAACYHDAPNQCPSCGAKIPEFQ